MKSWLAWFTRAEPALSPASARDASALAAIHAASFNRGWSEQEFEQLLTDRSVIADRVTRRAKVLGFILSRRAADEAEILSVAVARAARGEGLARRLLDLHLRRLAGFGLRAVFLEVEEDNVPARRLYARAGFQEAGRRKDYYIQGRARPAAALVLRRDLV
ncbi:MAG: ribosomal protein S18-alanine N-acetyltransferase [Alphaproteobacteria bacterium]|nr:ribosomal protein S18-alanine N-acetyltransferase [Alphaproteobacteria bacterium]